ncbi:hypothetical protein D869_gp133 [Caulobacter phage CcrRogue]|uniref:Uncharacterized protein n=1 Tax=Caulobacter phage CcrRogue TaxID=2927986 RepID=K4JP41_9CAUD|nr:hypothetical protein D869_gp133 [Caulobacter phage CcrRogue]AFU86781.1 hypothetical protein CcrRogue_gp299 [Caulobacter phage CcrRogue]
MPQPKTATISRALAYLAITGGTNCLTINTRIALHPYHKLVPVTYKIGDTELTRHVYKLTDEGQALAEKSKLWKGHQKLVEMGFKFQARRRQSSRFLSYDHATDDCRKDRRGAFISGDSPYAQPAPGQTPEGKKDWDYIKVEV